MVESNFSASFTPEEQEFIFGEILRIYDHADNVMAIVAEEEVPNRELKLQLVRPFITQSTNAVNIISALYTEVVRNGRPVTPELQDTMEGAFRIFYSALEDIISGMEQKLLPQGGQV